MDVSISRLCARFRVEPYLERTLADLKVARERATDFQVAELFGCPQTEASAGFRLLFELSAWTEVFGCEKQPIGQLFSTLGIQSEPNDVTIQRLIRSIKDKCGVE